MHSLRIWCLTVLCLGSATLAHGFEGRDFIFGFLPLHDEQTDALRAEVQLTSERGARVTIVHEMSVPTFTRTVYVPPNTSVTVAVPIRATQLWIGSAARNAVRLFTPDPEPARFSAVMIARTRFASDSAMILPVHMLGTEYLPVMPEPDPIKPNNRFLVVATEDDTEVTITPTADLVGGFTAGTPFVLTLDRLYGFLARADPFTLPAGLTGSTVSATKPVAVSAGDMCSFIPPLIPACDSVVEMSLPLDRWGDRAPVQGLPARPAGSIYRVVAAANGTAVTLDGVPLGPTLNGGEHLTTEELPGAHLFAANGPISVLQMMTGGSLVPPAHLGDPATVDMLPPRYYGRRHRFAAVGPGQFDRHWVTVIAQGTNAGAGGVRLDGRPIPPADFTAVPGTALASTVQEVALGTHVVTSSGPHHVTVEGASEFDSYAHTLASRTPDHYLCYLMRAKLGATVHLADAFGDGEYAIRLLRRLCAPADKNAEGVTDPGTHLTLYVVRGPRPVLHRAVRVENQFGSLTLDLKVSKEILVPASKTHWPAPPPAAPDPAAHEVDHYRCLKARISRGAPSFPKGVQTTIADQFGERAIDVVKPLWLCVPTDKNGEGIRFHDDLQLCYRIKDKLKPTAIVSMTDQLATFTSSVGRPRELCVPTRLQTTCCREDPLRCIDTAGQDAGSCATPEDAAACANAGGHCIAVSCGQRCGNGALEPYCCEECDDGTTLEGDGCSARCKVQPCCIPQSTRCVQDPTVPCDESADCVRAGVNGVCQSFSCPELCGDGQLQPWCCEECDDGNRRDTDGCTNECVRGIDEITCVPQPVRCQNAVHIPCQSDADCPGSTGPCVGLFCPALCGDGTIDDFCCEECDDGTRLDGDGCSRECKVQPCCVPQPSRCQNDERVPCDGSDDCTRAGVGGVCVSFRCDSRCGDGELQPYCCEQCDDGDTCYGDGTLDL